MSRTFSPAIYRREIWNFSILLKFDRIRYLLCCMPAWAICRSMSIVISTGTCSIGA